ncbi:MAG: RluA family pseudouridine synthase [Candidatus Desulfatibia sp.]|uniref:RluA family pseudouridine synthase n=1 Tax=Candidatus Desulfatibia sp. TaxID=3101189 RepID=UPI002F330021
MPNASAFTILVDEANSGRRLDLFVASRIAACSRAVATGLIRNGAIRVQGVVKKPGYRVRPGDAISGRIPPPVPVDLVPEPLDINILFEDKHLIVVNKPPDLVVHPAPGHATGTLVHGLLYHCPDLEGIGGELRPGIVHRLDKDTSGVLVVAKNAVAHQHLARQFKSRKIKKDYLALVHGEMQAESGTISLPVGRHPTDRKRMSTASRKSRGAETSWQVRKRLWGATLIDLKLKTGRTHQIRVHCTAMGHPIVGDTVYGGRRTRKTIAKGNGLSDIFAAVTRQMLHARRLEFVHPATETTVTFEAPVPRDMQELIRALRLQKQSPPNPDNS